MNSLNLYIQKNIISNINISCKYIISINNSTCNTYI